MTMHSPTLVLPIGRRDHLRGLPTAPVTLLEYGDYECPFCGAAHPIVEELRRLQGPAMAFVFRHFPLTNVHPHAEKAAESAEAAGAQGRFWQMHDTLFMHQDALDFESLVEYAGLIGLDVNRITNELRSGLHAPKVREDFMSGVRSGVNGTPTFFINGVRHDGGWDLATLARAVEQAMTVGR